MAAELLLCNELNCAPPIIGFTFFKINVTLNIYRLQLFGAFHTARMLNTPKRLPL